MILIFMKITIISRWERWGEEESKVKGLVQLPSNTTIRCFRLAGLERDIHVISKAAGVREWYLSQLR